MKLTLTLGHPEIPLQQIWPSDQPQPKQAIFHNPLPIALHYSNCWAMHHNDFLFVVMGTPTIALPDSVTSLAEAQSLMATLEGNAVAILLDLRGQKLQIRTDILGIAPLYFRASSNGITIASETKCFGDQPNINAWAELIHYGFQFSDHTLVNDVNMFPAASITSWQLPDLRFTTQTYWRWPAPNFSPNLTTIADSFQDNVRQYLSNHGNGQVLLSGGLDSRLILFALLKEQQRPECLIVNHFEEAFNTDGRIAQKLARNHKLPYRILSPTADYYSSTAFMQHISDCDACYPTLDLFISQLSPFIRDRAVWEGAIPNYTISTVLSQANDLSAQLNSIGASFNGPQWQSAAKIFKPIVIEQMRYHLESLSGWAKEHFTDDEFGAHELMARSRLRRRTAVVPSSIYQKNVPVLLPGLCKNFLDASASLPFAARQHGQLYEQLYRQSYPSALSLPIISGGKILTFDNAPLMRELIKCQSKLAQFIGRRPRLKSLLNNVFSAQPRQDNPLLNRAFLHNSEDSLLREDFDCHTSSNEHLQKLLFQWQSWRLLHQGKLNECAQPFLNEHKPL